MDVERAQFLIWICKCYETCDVQRLFQMNTTETLQHVRQYDSDTKKIDYEDLVGILVKMDAYESATEYKSNKRDN